MNHTKMIPGPWAGMKVPRGASAFLGASATPERLLRWSLGIVYLWFGTLKLVSMSPVLELIRRSYPPLAMLPLYLGLALFETGLGVALLAGVWKRWTPAAVVLHLIGTFGVLVFSPQAAFSPQFPFLTMDGEFVVKNLVLLAAAGALWLMAAREPAAASPPLRLWTLVPLLVVAGGLGLAATPLQQLTAIATRYSGGAPGAAWVGGAPPAGVPVRMTAAAIGALTRGGRAPSLMLQGVVVDRCPLLGCWLRLRDGTGVVFVDLASAGLSVRGVPMGSRIQVAGRLGETRLGKVGFVASSIKPLAGKGTG